MSDTDLLQLSLEFIIFCYYGYLSLYVSVHRAVTKIGGAYKSQTGTVVSFQVVPQSCNGREGNLKLNHHHTGTYTHLSS